MWALQIKEGYRYRFDVSHPFTGFWHPTTSNVKNQAFEASRLFDVSLSIYGYGYLRVALVVVLLVVRQ